MSVEEVLSSRGRVRILRVLVEVGGLNVSGIARRAGLNYSTTRHHLEVLERLGVVRHRRFGRVRIFQLNHQNPRVEILKKLIEVWTDR